MASPIPPSPIDGHCSVVNGQTLYVLSSGSFQSLPLTKNATWSTLPMGVPVIGSSCTHVQTGQDASTAAMYVVGGTPLNGTASTGLQKYIFSTGQWETLSPPTNDMAGRTGHGVVQLWDSNSLFVYAGEQTPDFTGLATSTFTISLSPPYNIVSYSSPAPPANRPIVVVYSGTTAMLVSKQVRSNEIWLFNAAAGTFSQYATSITVPISAGAQGILLTGQDQSQVLSLFDLSVSPNIVQQIVVSAAGGGAAENGRLIPSGAQNTKRTLTQNTKRTLTQNTKRALTLSDWPSYNTSDSPNIVRSDYSIAQDMTGLAVFVGGNAQSPVNVYNANSNGWSDNGLLFDGVPNQNVLGSSSTSSSSIISSTSSTSSFSSTSVTSSSSSLTTSSSSRSTSTTPSATNSAAAAASAPNPGSDDASRHKMLKVLGITLGVLGGIAVLFIFMLLLLRWRRRRQRQSGFVDEKNGRMSFQDRGSPFMKLHDSATGSQVDLTKIPPNHRFTQHNTSHNTFAILAGKFGRRASRGLLAPQIRHNRQGSTDSNPHLLPKKRGDVRGPVELDMWGKDKEVFTNSVSASGAPQIPASAIGAKESLVADKKRGSGWSRYFAPADADPRIQQELQQQQQHQQQHQQQQNFYNPALREMTTTQIPGNVLVPPPDLSMHNNTYDGTRVSRVMTASPSFNHSSEDLARRGSSLEAARGQRAQFQSTTQKGHRRFDSEGLESINDESSDRHSSELYDTSNPNNPSITTNNWTPLANDSSFIETQTSPALGSSPSGRFDAPRAPSSAYTASYYGGDHTSRVLKSTLGANSASPSRPISHGNASSTGDSGIFPLPPQQQQQSGKSDSNFERDSTITGGGVPSEYYQDNQAVQQQAAKQSTTAGTRKDRMSWLNLGLK